MDDLNSGIYIENSRLFSYAAAEAELLKAARDGSGRKAAAELRSDMSDIKHVYEKISERSSSVTSLPASWEWLLDNYYILQLEYLQAYGDLIHCRHIRICRGEPLIVLLCRGLLSSGQGRINEERCRIYLDGFQSVSVLRRCELCLFPAALKAEIISAVSCVCRSMEYSCDESALAEAMEALIKSMRLLSALDAEELISSCDRLDSILSRDPAGCYAHMDAVTKRSYLQRVEKLARRSGLHEDAYAAELIKRAEKDGRHIGFYLFSEPDGKGAEIYTAGNILLTLFLSLLPALALDSIWAALLLLLPVSELVKNFLDFMLLRIVKPHPLPRMDISTGIPEEGRTMLVISAVLSSADDAGSLCRRLEELYFGCENRSVLSFALLADLPESSEKECSGDREIISRAESAVNSLNRRYGGGFYLFTRERRFDGEKYCGRDRKRGAVMELAALLRDRDSELRVCGERDSLCSVHYIITLDSDTLVYPGDAEVLISAMLHPLCRAVVDEKKGVVIQGRGIIQPRIAVDLKSANATDFALISAGTGGFDPYGGLCSELYMDAFGSGGFSGKGIIDVSALDKCLSERLPEGRILSHDALEGAFLHSGFMGEAEFSDAFPSGPLSFFRRQHRWIRGDWQNLPYIFCPVLPAAERWRLFDSVRRSLTAPAMLLAVVLGFFIPVKGLYTAAAAALLAVLSRLFLVFAEAGFKPREKIRIRRYTRLLAGTGGAAVHSLMRLWLLPFEAWTAASAVCTALWRMTVSGKNLLQWQTSASAGKSPCSLTAHKKAMWFPLLLGSVLLFSSPVIIGRSAGLMWLLSPLCAFALSLPACRERELSRTDREFLLNAAEENLRYFRRFCTEEDNYLPPDNFQEQPPIGLAHRTSPTNIGLALCSFAAAADMELMSRSEAEEHIGKMLDTVERLPKCLGHLYNWYDTRSLSPLSPAFISTVDSGNLCACLICLKQALREYGNNELAGKVDRLMAPMDFSPLYDRKRELFYICYNSAEHRGTGGWYDLMASEAMLTGYVAIARGDISIKHWKKLSRAQLQKDGYRGLASWTGTMFEYLMPEIFLPFSRGSLLWESSRFCLYVQKREIPPGRPWGISESACSSLDPALNYRYRANGCASLALKRDQGRDIVVSPYSSFLALAADSEGAVKNLRRLRQFGAAGSFGYMEALDFTPSRCRSSQGEKVRCYMAHHIGMSICSCADALCSGIMQRRFMASPATSAMSLLLQERLPSDGRVIKRDRIVRPELPFRFSEAKWHMEGRNGREQYCLLSNGIYHILCSSSGFSSSRWGNTGIMGLPGAESAELSIKIGDRKYSLLPGGMESWSFKEDICSWEAHFGQLELKHSLSAAAAWAGELRETIIRTCEPVSGELHFSFRPVLSAVTAYLDHPAFWKLGITAESADGCLLLRRLRRGSEPGCWLCIRSDLPSEYASEGGRFSRYISCPLAEVRTAFRLRAGEALSLRTAVAAGRTAEEVLENSRMILQSRDRGAMSSAAALHLGMGMSEYSGAMSMLPALLRPLSGACPRRELWKYGISGDLPVICCKAGTADALKILNRFCLLKACGMETDLVFLSSEEGEYRRSAEKRISGRLAALSLLNIMGRRGGVHFVPLSEQELICSRAAYTDGGKEGGCNELRMPVLGDERADSSSPEYSSTPEGFSFYVENDLPARIWQHILTNSHFSCIVSDCGAGAMWLENAREQRINIPPQDARSVAGTEAMYFEREGVKTSLFAANDSLPCSVFFGPGYAVWKKELPGRTLRLTAFVPVGTDARVFIAEGAEGLELSWLLKPVLAQDASSLVCSFRDGIFECMNPESYLDGVAFRASSSGTLSCRSDFSPPAMSMGIRGSEVTVLVCGTCALNDIRALCIPENAFAALGTAKLRCKSFLGRFRLRGGGRAFENYMNCWAVYQCTACRLEARSSIYQSGGAFGFRDQLQDSINILLMSTGYARDRILDCCLHQYTQGDVMHWWHPHPSGDRGVRTRCSDDLLWLCWALCEYAEMTGDTAICREKTPYLISSPLAENERDRYEAPEPSAFEDSVLDHVRRALDRCLSIGHGPHGLPLFGSGDWNDGMDEAGGESVWLGWFLSLCAFKFSKLLEKLGESDAAFYYAAAERFGLAADNAWNGSFYYRGYLADGSPLGGEERIDSLPQSFAVFNPFSDRKKAEAALKAALSRLVDRENSIIKLFDPPFSPDEPSPGYITSYGMGFRENGGQYTHAAVWLASACFRAGMRREGEEIMQMLLPENHTGSIYEAEPFVLPADVYSAPGHEGQAGWTWYTGSAGWYFRTAAEDMLGLKLKDGRLGFTPPGSASGLSYSITASDLRGHVQSFSFSPFQGPGSSD